MLSTQMALLRPSANIRYVGTQKDTYGLKVASNTIDGHVMNYIHYPSSLPFLPFHMSIDVRDFSYEQPVYIHYFSYNMSRVVREYLSLQPVYISVRGFPL